MAGTWAKGTVLTFGKYRGWNLRDVPEDYLDWCLDNLRELSPYWRQLIRQELFSRGHRHPGFDDDDEDNTVGYRRSDRGGYRIVPVVHDGGDGVPLTPAYPRLYRCRGTGEPDHDSDSQPALLRDQPRGVASARSTDRAGAALPAGRLSVGTLG